MNTPELKDQRHKSMDVLQTYARDACLFRDHDAQDCFSRLSALEQSRLKGIIVAAEF
jgi:hypothetical protein